MLKSVVRLHTAILATASVALLIVPGKILESFGVIDPSFSVLSLTRILAGLIGVLAAAVYPLPDLPVSARGKALTIVAISYALLAALTIAQQVAIWSSVAGLLLSVECLIHAGAFAWLAASERRAFSI